MAYADGTFTSFNQVGVTRISYPFLNAQTKDATTKRYAITGWVLPSSYATANALTTYPGDGLFPADNTAYLVDESEPRDGGGFYIVDRAYCTIPGDQIEYTTRLFPRPVMHDIVSGNTYAVSFDDGDTTHLFSTRINVSAVGAITQPNTSVVVAGETFGKLPTATFTIVDSGNHSSSPLFDATASSMQSTLSAALTSLNSIAVSSTVGSLTISWVGTVKSVGTTDANVTMSGGAGLNGMVTFTAARASVDDTQAPAQAPYVRVITTDTNHNGATGNRVALWNGDRLVAAVPAIAASANVITVPADIGALSVGNVAITHCGFDVDANYRYVNGPKDCTVKRTTKFYLPTVTPNVNTAADIPVVNIYADPLGWLGQIVAGSTYAAVATSELSAFAGPILMKSYDEVQMSDALESRTP